MDIFDQNEDLIQTASTWGDTSFYTNYPIDPNIISGSGGDPVLPKNPYDYGTPIFHYPDKDETYYSPMDKKIWEQNQQDPLTTAENKLKVPYIPPENTLVPLNSQETGYDLKEFIKKPEVIGVGVLIVVVLIYKIIKS